MGTVQGSDISTDPLQEVAREWLTVVGQLISDSRNKAIGVASDSVGQEKVSD